MSLQQKLNQPSDNIVLPQGVYEESIVIQHPCVVQGNDTTIVSSRGPVIQVNAPNVTLRNLCVYLAGEPGVCIRTNSPHTTLENVELNGALDGFPEEESQWILPSLVDVGVFAAGSEKNRVAFPLNAPAELKVSHNLRGVELSVHTLSPGLNKALLTIRNIEDSRTLYGAISAVRSGVIRKIRIYGQARANVSPLAPPSSYAFTATSGKRLDVLSHILRIRLNPCAPKNFEVEPFVFLLNQRKRAQRDEDLLFFNCRVANGVRLEESGEIFLNLDAINPSVHQVTIAFSIYGNQKDLLFHQLKGHSLLIDGESPHEFHCALSLDNLQPVKTLIALDIERKANAKEWEILFRKEAYPDGLPKLCEYYGLDVES